MKIRIDDIPEGGSPLSFSGSEDILSESLAAVPTPGGVVIDPHIKGDLLIVNEGTKVTITGSIQANMHLQCARCLAAFPLETTVNFGLAVAWEGAGAQLQEDQEEIDENTIIIEGPVLDISEMILQEILLEIPMKPLCREDCPGLCPRCGALKGSKECTCPDDAAIDTRWNALTRLKKDMLS
jgi:uncharacterized protein